MSNNDSFIDEVTEAVRRDKLFAVMRKYGWIGIAAIVAIVGAAAWSEWQKAQAQARAEAFGDGLIAALGAPDDAARAEALAAVPATGGQAAVTGFLAASEAMAREDRQGALDRLAAIAGDAALPPVYRQLAALKRVVLLGAEMPAADRDAALAELAAPGAPFRPLAMEQQGLALAADGKRDEAIKLFNQLLQEPALTPALRRRVTQVIVALGGEVQAG